MKTTLSVREWERVKAFVAQHTAAELFREHHGRMGDLLNGVALYGVKRGKTPRFAYTPLAPGLVTEILTHCKGSGMKSTASAPPTTQ